MNTRTITLAGIVVALILAACGGGGDDEDGVVGLFGSSETESQRAAIDNAVISAFEANQRINICRGAFALYETHFDPRVASTKWSGPCRAACP